MQGAELQRPFQVFCVRNKSKAGWLMVHCSLALAGYSEIKSNTAAAMVDGINT